MNIEEEIWRSISLNVAIASSKSIWDITRSIVREKTCSLLYDSCGSLTCDLCWDSIHESVHDNLWRELNEYEY